MAETDDYVPPKVWVWDNAKDRAFGKLNRPIAGASHQKELPRGNHALQVYSAATPNGIKVILLLEELLASGRSDAEYDLWSLDILEAADQFGSEFVEVNPNSKIPAMLDLSGSEPIRVFDSCSTLLYLAEKFGAFIPEGAKHRAECLNWLFWQVSATPMLGGGFGHFYVFAPTKIEYAIDRFAMETKRQCDVLNMHLADNEYMAGGEYSIADIAVFCWYGSLVKGMLYGADEFLSVHEYPNLIRWADKIFERPTVMRSVMTSQLLERHSALDLRMNTVEG